MPGHESARGAEVEIECLTVQAGDRLLLENASARFEPGCVTLIVGASGAGKSLLLRVLAGLVDPARREIRVNGRVRIGGHEPGGDARGRPAVGIVFQNFALFDELSPEGNVRFAFDHRSRVIPGGEAALPAGLLEELGVPRGVRTALLSGGQRQRVAIARTLAYRPDVILYDEPTSGLDPSSAALVAGLLGATQASHPRTSVIVTHDFAALAGIADQIFLLDALSRSLRALDRADWPRLGGLIGAPREVENRPPQTSTGGLPVPGGRLRAAGAALRSFLEATPVVSSQLLLLPLRLLPAWRSPTWGLRFLLHYLRLVAGPSAWLYMAIAGAILGFVSTYFTFRFLPYRPYTEPLVIENLLGALGFSLWRILTPVLGTLLIAARSAAAVASDVGGKVYGQQFDAMRSFGAPPERYLLTGILYAFLIGSPVLVLVAFFAARLTSLVVFTATHAQLGPFFWESNFHRELVVSSGLYRGTGWLVAKVLVCATGLAFVSYQLGASPKDSGHDVSSAITSTILWGTLWVLAVHFVFALLEFQ